MNLFQWIVVIAIIALEVWYWGVYFPRAWRDHSNQEIEDLRQAFRLMREQRKMEAANEHRHKLRS